MMRFTFGLYALVLLCVSVSAAFFCGGNEICIFTGFKPTGEFGTLSRSDFSCPVDAPLVSGISPGAGREGFEFSVTLGMPVHAAAAGRVLHSGFDGSNLGYFVEVLHSENPRVETRYGYLFKAAVRENDRLKKGDVIGQSGTRPNGGEARLYFEMRREGKFARDPESFCRSITTAKSQSAIASSKPTPLPASRPVPTGVYDVSSRIQFQASSVAAVSVGACVKQTEEACLSGKSVFERGRTWRTADPSCIFRKASTIFQVPYSLLRAVLSQESGGRQFADSGLAQGFTQLAPGTALGMGIGPDRIFDPYYNICGGVHYFARQLKAFGTVECALAAYNAGPGAVRGKDPKNCVPVNGETEKYVPNIMSMWDRNMRSS